MNIYDIAKLAGVSIATVSRVMNGSDRVSEKTRQKVLSIIEEESYTPNIFAKGLGLHTMHTIGILVPTISDMYMSRAVSYLEEELQEFGYDCILSCSGFEQEKKAAHVQLLLSKHIDALIMIGSNYAGEGSRRDTEYIRKAAPQIPVFIIKLNRYSDRIITASCSKPNAVCCLRNPSGHFCVCILAIDYLGLDLICSLLEP